LTASAANAGGFLQTTLSKLPRLLDLCLPAFLLRGSPDRNLTFVGTNLESVSASKLFSGSNAISAVSLPEADFGTELR